MLLVSDDSKHRILGVLNISDSYLHESIAAGRYMTIRGKLNEDRDELEVVVEHLPPTQLPLSTSDIYESMNEEQRKFVQILLNSIIKAGS